MKLSPETVEKIKAAADIVKVAALFDVQLTKKGDGYIAPCIFHDDKIKSLLISPSKQIYKCMGCGQVGDSVKFTMDLNGLSYEEALFYLAHKFDVDLNEDI